MPEIALNRQKRAQVAGPKLPQIIASKGPISLQQQRLGVCTPRRAQEGHEGLRRESPGSIASHLGQDRTNKRKHFGQGGVKLGPVPGTNRPSSVFQFHSQIAILSRLSLGWVGSVPGMIAPHGPPKNVYHMGLLGFRPQMSEGEADERTRAQTRVRKRAQTPVHRTEKSPTESVHFDRDSLCMYSYLFLLSLSCATGSVLSGPTGSQIYILPRKKSADLWQQRRYSRWKLARPHVSRLSDCWFS